MSNIVTIGLYCEGATDERFLLSIIKRTFDEIAMECSSQLEVYYPERIPYIGGPFVEAVKKATILAYKQGVMVLCVHTDADDRNDRTAFQFKITPAFAAVEGPESCEVLVAVVPVRITEAWMLADIELLQEEIGNVAPQAIRSHHYPESEADPKATIEEIIRAALADRPRRQRGQLCIGDLYQPIGQKLALSKLEKLGSYVKFKEEVRAAYRKLNYLS